MTRFIFLAIIYSLFSVACSISPETKQQPLTTATNHSALPGIAEQIENSFSPASLNSTSYCVNWSGNIAQDRVETSLAAKGQLLMVIKDKARLMDAALAETSAESKYLSNPFSSIVDETAKEIILRGRPSKIEVIKKDGDELLCAYAKLEPETSEKIFNKLLFNSGLKLTDQQKTTMTQAYFTMDQIKPD